MSFITKLLQELFPKKSRHDKKMDNPDRDIKFYTQNTEEEAKKRNFEMVCQRANNGDALAMTDLGVFYLHGTGTPVDIEK